MRKGFAPRKMINFNSLLTDSGIQFTDNYNEVNSFNYTLEYSFENNTEYYFTVEY